MDYKWCKKLGVKIIEGTQIDCCERESLQKVLKKKKIAKQFYKLFGIQTQSIAGPYAHDVEAVFVRIFDNKLVGTQLFWD